MGQASARAEDADRRAAQAVELAAGDLTNQRDLIDAQAGLARTTKQRQDSALRLLDLQEQEEKLQLTAVYLARTSTDAQKKAAADRLNQLGGIYGARRAGVLEDTASPLQAYRNRLNKSPDELAEDAERAVVDQLDYVQRGITDALTKRLGVKDPLIASILSMFIEQQLLRPIANALASAGGGGGGLLGGFKKLLGIGATAAGLKAPSVGDIAGLLGKGYGGGRANGGPVLPGMTYTVGERGPETLRMGAMGGMVIPNLNQSVVPARGGRPSVTAPVNISIDARGADSGAVARLEAWAARTEAQLPGRIIATVKNAQERFAL